MTMKPPVSTCRDQKRFQRAACPGPGGQRDHFRPLLERLEDRTLLSTFDVLDGVGHYLASADVNNVVSLAQIGTVVTLTDSAESIELFPTAIALGYSGSGTRTILGPAAVLTSISVDLVDRADLVIVESAELTLPVDARNLGGTTELRIDDSGAGAARQATISASSVVLDPSAAVSYAAANLTSLDLFGGDGGNDFLVTATPEGITTTLSTGIADSVDVQQASGLLRVIDPGGFDSISVNQAARFEHVILRGFLTIDGVSNGELLAPEDIDLYVIDAPEGGFLDLRLSGPPGIVRDSRLTLSGIESFVHSDGMPIGGGGLLINSVQESEANPQPVIADYLLPGIYFVAISAARTAQPIGVYALSATLTPGADPFPRGIQASTLAVGADPRQLVTGDFNWDGIADLATVNRGSGDVSILLGIGDGSFEPQRRIIVGGVPEAIAATDLNSDGRLDLAILDPGTNLVTVFSGVGDGTFLDQNPTLLPADDPLVDDLFTGPPSIAAFADFNRDGVVDLVNLVAVNDDGQPPFLSVLSQGLGVPLNRDLFIETPFGIGPVSDFLEDNLFLPANTITSSPARAIPLQGDLDGDGVDDVVTVDREGAILFRRGRADQAAAFEPAQLVNGPGTPLARGAAIISEGPGGRLAAIDLEERTLSLYELGPAGQWVRTGSLTTGGVPARIEAGDLNGDGTIDLIVANNLFGFASLSIYRGEADGSFTPVQTVKVGTSISDVLLVDRERDGFADVLLTNPDAGDVGVLVNQRLPDPRIGFEEEVRFRAGAGPYGVSESPVSQLANAVFFELLGIPDLFPAIYFAISDEVTAGVAVGDFNGDTVDDVVVTNRGHDTFGLLLGQAGAGPAGLTNPETFSTGDAPTMVRAADFDRDDDLDIAILHEGQAQISIFLNDGLGHLGDGQGQEGPFALVGAGNAPTGLTVAQLNDDNGDTQIDDRDYFDLLVGNEFGDLLILLGNGDGTFRPFQRAGQSIPMGVTMVNGQEMIVMGNESLDRVSLAPPNVDVTLDPAFQDRQNGIQGPGNVQLADVNRDDIRDLIVANSGSNNVLIYLGLPDGDFGAEINGGAGFFTGTNPVGVTVANVNPDQDTFVDLVVANRGSNDVTILLGNGNGTFRYGPRLVNAGVDPSTGNQVGVAPTSTVVEDVDDDGMPDILVSFGESGNVGFIQGAGAGAFRDNETSFTAVGGTPGAIISLLGDRFVTLNFGSNSISLLSGFDDGTFQRQELSTRGDNPNSALAGDFNGDGAADLLVGSNGDGMLELFLDNGGELMAAGFLDTDLNISAMALSVVQGSRVFYVTSDGVEQAFAFSLDMFMGEDRGTVADLPGDSVAIIAALVTGSVDVSVADFFAGQEGETVNFGELLFFSDTGFSAEGAGGGGDSSSEVLEQLRGFVRQFIQDWYVTFGTVEGTAWQIVLDVSRDVLHFAATAPEQVAEVFGCWQTVVSHLRLPEIGEVAVNKFLAASRSLLQPIQAADAATDSAALVDAAFRDGFLETFEFVDLLFREPLAGPAAEEALPQRSGADWQEWLAASLLACGFPGWVIREATRREEHDLTVPGSRRAG